MQDVVELVYLLFFIIFGVHLSLLDYLSRIHPGDG